MAGAASCSARTGGRKRISRPTANASPTCEKPPPPTARRDTRPAFPGPCSCISILIFASATFPIPSKRESRDFSHLPPAGACPRAGRRPDPGAGAGTGPLPGRPALAGRPLMLRSAPRVRAEFTLGPRRARTRGRGPRTGSGRVSKHAPRRWSAVFAASANFLTASSAGVTMYSVQPSTSPLPE